MPDLEPITRKEKLLDGEDLTPITRKEQFIKRIYDKTQEIPEPITREEMFLKKAGEGGGGDIDLQTLNVTENGTVNAPSGVAYNKVVTDVPQPTMTKLTATENRTYTAPSGTAYNEVDVDVPLPSNAYLLKELSNLPQPIASFSDGADAVMQSLKVDIKPVQDLHGYDSTWAGGAGKNKLPMTVDGIKSANTSGTWSDNSYVLNGVTFTIETDSDGNVTGVRTTGTANANAIFNVSAYAVSDSVYLNGCPSNGSSSTYRLDAFGSSGLSEDYGNGVLINAAGERNVRIVIFNGYAIPSGGLLFKPMIRLDSESDATFAPYSNICPISGWTEEVVTRTGKNLCGGSALLDAISKAMPTATISDDEITFSGSTGGSGNKYFAFNKFEPNTQYTAILNGSGNLKNVRWFYTDGTYDASTLVPDFGSPYVSNASKTVAYLGKINNSASTTIKTSTSGIFKGAITAQDFEPYAGTTTTIPFTDSQGNPVEVYGGKIDVINGTSRNEKTKEGVDLSTLIWEVRYTGEVNQTISASLPSEYLQRTPVFMAEQYVRNGYVGGVASLNNPDERPIGIWNYRGSSSTETSTTTTIYMVVPKNTTPQGKLVYDIATPTTFYTQPTAVKSLDGDNNVFASTGDVEELKYFSKEV